MYARTLLGLTLVMGCTASTSPDSAIRVHIAVSSAVLHAGDSITVAVTVQNAGDTPRSISANECPEQFVVTTSDGTVVAPGVGKCSDVATSKRLEPGEQIAFVTRWNGDALPAKADQPNTLLAPGTYYLRPLMYRLDAQDTRPTITILP